MSDFDVQAFFDSFPHDCEHGPDYRTCAECGLDDPKRYCQRHYGSPAPCAHCEMDKDSDDRSERLFRDSL